MNDKLVGKVSEYIDAVATKLGVAAEHVYGLLVRQQVVDGVISVVSGGLLMTAAIILSVILAKKVVLKLDFEYMDSYDIFPMFAMGAVTLLVIGGMLFGGYSMLTDGVQHLLNPEYYAIKEIIKAVK